MRIYLKFRNAFRGLTRVIREPRTYLFHIICGICAITLSIFLKLPIERIVIVIILVAGVLSAELFNDSVETLAHFVSKGEKSDIIKLALDISAGAVLLVSLTAVLVGVLFFLPPILELING
ncbi:diacylglycerol kinase family protein [bacterium]|nr:diacylglycerol kinase family protein [bacterium]